MARDTRHPPRARGWPEPQVPTQGGSSLLSFIPVYHSPPLALCWIFFAAQPNPINCGCWIEHDGQLYMTAGGLQWSISVLEHC